MSEKIIKELLQQAKLYLDSQRKKDIEKRINIYKDNWYNILSTEVDNQFHKDTRGNIKQMIDDSSNILKRIINEISLVYQKPASRIFMVNEKENDAYSEVMNKIPTDVIMQECNRMTNLCNESGIYIVPRNNRIEYDVVTPDSIEVFQDEEDPTIPVAILITRTYVDTVGNQDIRKVYWDIYGNHKLFDENDQEIEMEDNPEGINPYKDPKNKDRTILPFVLFHKNYPKDSIWDRTGGQDLISGTLQIGVLLTYLNYLMKVNSFKQLTLVGVRTDEVEAPLILDPLHPLAIKDPSGKIQTIDHNTSLKDLWDIIYHKIGALANNYGLSLDNFKLTADAQSGYALEIKNMGLEKVVDEQRKMYRHHENELFEKTRIVSNSMVKLTKFKTIPEEGTFKIDFQETEYPESPDDIRKQWAFDIKMGAKSVYDYLRYINPDIKSDQEAEKYLASNVEINDLVKTQYNIDIDGLVAQALKEGGAGSPGGGQGGLLG